MKPRVPYGPRRVDRWRAAFDRGDGELVHESDKLNPQQMALGLEAVGKMTNIDLQCVSTAHTRMRCAEAKAKTGQKFV